MSTQLSVLKPNGVRQDSQPDEDLRRLVRGDSVHRTLYTDPSIFDKEMVRVFGGTWTYVAHESQIPKNDDFFYHATGRSSDHRHARRPRENQCSPESLYPPRVDSLPRTERKRQAIPVSVPCMDVFQ